ncbi:MAG TPA: transketolase C-terminal domain-containing protein [Bdellovibrionota bacterium]|nr:transketolase C-terminal domain-containing protein [Bdellovibrionota bacterium]
MRKRWLETLNRLAVEDERIVFIGSDLTADAGMKKFHEDIGPRFFMEGVSEMHIVGMAAGMAMCGRIPYVNTIATFLTRRCYEQNMIDVGHANVKVRLIGGGGGLVYAPLGPTHLATEDIAIMRSIPNMTVVAPCDADEMERAIEASVDWPGPIYFRVAKGGEATVSRKDLGFEIGKAIVHRAGGDVLLIDTGTMLQTALAAADQLAKQGISCGVIHAHTVKPFDRDAVIGAIRGARVVLTLEEHAVNGGLGGLVAELVAETRMPRTVAFKRIGLPDAFMDEYGSQDSLKAKFGLDAGGIAASAVRLLADA